MAKGRYSRLPARKSSSSTMILTLLLMFTFVILILLALGILSIPSNSGDPSRKANDLSTIVHNKVDRYGVFAVMLSSVLLNWNWDLVIYLIVCNCSIEGDDGGQEHWAEVISWEPRASIYHNFLSKEECDYLINLAKPHMQKSTVVDSETGKSKDSRVRTSSGTFLPRGRDKKIREIEKRIADFTFIPVEHGEGLQVLHYEVGQKYEPHFDYFMDEFNTKNGGQRIATVLMYLSDVEEGGETVFPSAKGNYSAVPWWNELSECGKGGLSVKPKMGDALLFWSMKPDASLDPSSLHGGCAVIKGNKWSATKWMRVNEYKV
ncbi:probable prolyl 4-hydroxylase 10 isoform X1 [Hevea brasiliensis]|uniref:probable prolyl 4-hydroxylase 10 isoform X1 n=1 Tax=Hevea brasiliensis TaxID=3981 RepID=UPI0025FEB005|nr:probable prolyl 4-hydroxylase 10 isoform X1 [Hevea brasiliensis]